MGRKAQVKVIFKSNPPRDAIWIDLRYTGRRPAGLLACLVISGWRIMPKGPGDSALYPWKKVILTRAGSAVSGGWAIDERLAFVKEARVILERHGIGSTLKQHLGLADML